MKKIHNFILATVILIFAIILWLAFSGYGGRIMAGINTFSSADPSYQEFPLGNNKTVEISFNNKKEMDYLLVFRAEFLTEKVFKGGGQKDYDKETDMRQKAFIGEAVTSEDNYSFLVDAYLGNKLIFSKEYSQKSANITVGGAKPDDKKNLARLRVFDLYPLQKGNYRFVIRDKSANNPYFAKVRTKIGIYPDRRIRK